MDPFQGIEVQIVSNGQVLKLYDDPDFAETSAERTKQHYIEAVNDATFKVTVILKNEFNFHNLKPTDAVQVALELDGQGDKRSKHFIRRETEPILLQRRSDRRSFDGMSHLCPTTGRWLRGDYSFARLETSKLHNNPIQVVGFFPNSKSEESTDTPISADLLGKLGQIQIRVKRVKRERRSVPKQPMMSGLTARDEVAEKALKGKAISNTVT